MKLFVFIWLVTISILNCRRPTSLEISSRSDNVPPCILAKIDSLKKQPVANPPIQIEEYDYNQENVYIVSAPCCDRFTTAVDAHCNYICAPSGGFTGKGDLKCKDFFDKAKYIRQVWKDERSSKK